MICLRFPIFTAVIHLDRFLFHIYHRKIPMGVIIIDWDEYFVESKYINVFFLWQKYNLPHFQKCTLHPPTFPALFNNWVMNWEGKMKYDCWSGSCRRHASTHFRFSNSFIKSTTSSISQIPGFNVFILSLKIVPRPFPTYTSGYGETSGPYTV